MTLRICLLVSLVFFISANPSYAVERVYRIADQHDSPVKIYSYEPQLQQGSSDYWNGNGRGLYQVVEYENTSNRMIVAVQITFYLFDVWNNPMGSMGAMVYSPSGYVSEQLSGSSCNVVSDLAPEGTNRLISAPNTDDPDLFLTGIVAISLVRFADGEIWKANTKEIVMQLSDVIPNIEERYFAPSS